MTPNRRHFLDARDAALNRLSTTARARQLRELERGKRSGGREGGYGKLRAGTETSVRRDDYRGYRALRLVDLSRNVIASYEDEGVGREEEGGIEFDCALLARNAREILRSPGGLIRSSGAIHLRVSSRRK